MTEDNSHSENDEQKRSDVMVLNSKKIEVRDLYW